MSYAKERVAKLKTKQTAEGTLAETMYQKGLVGLTHTTNVVNLMGILRSGYLKPLGALRTEPPILVNGKRIYPKSNIFGVNEDTVFLSPLLAEKLGSLLTGNIMIILSPNVLNSKEFYYNTAWAHGNFELKDGALLNTKRLTFGPEELSNKFSEINSRGEFVFAPEYGIEVRNHLVKILIPKIMFLEIQKIAEENKIDISLLPIEVSENFQGLGEDASKNLQFMPDFHSTGRIAKFREEFGQMFEMSSLAMHEKMVRLKDPNISRSQKDFIVKSLYENKSEYISSESSFLTIFNTLREIDYANAHWLAVKLFEEIVYNKKITRKTVNRIFDQVLFSAVYCGWGMPNTEIWLWPFAQPHHFTYLFGLAVQSDQIGKNARAFLSLSSNKTPIKENPALQEELMQLLRNGLNTKIIPKDVVLQWLKENRYIFTYDNHNELCDLIGRPYMKYGE